MANFSVKFLLIFHIGSYSKTDDKYIHKSKKVYIYVRESSSKLEVLLHRVHNPSFNEFLSGFIVNSFHEVFISIPFT